MTSRRTLARHALAVLPLAAFAGCYHGKNDVPHLSVSSSAGAGGSATSSGGPGGGTSSSSSSAGTGGQGSTSSSSAGTGGADPCLTALLCDDFESYPTGAPPGGKWTANQTSGTITVDTTHAHSGTKAVKLSADAATYRSVMIGFSDKNLLPTPSGVVYGRMMFWLESAPNASVHWTFIDGSGLVPGQNYHAIYRYGGQLPVTNNGTFVGSQLMANYETPDSYQTPPVGPGSDCWLHSNKEVVPVAAWSCAEWEFDTGNNTMRFWLGGTELKDLAMTGTGQGCVHQPATFSWLAPSVESINLGWESYQMDAARVIWIDDVAIGTQRLGCPP